MLSFGFSKRAGWRCRRGVAAIEFALVGSLFFISLLAAIEVGRFFMTIQGLRNVVADASRYGMVNMQPGTLCGAALINAMGRQGVIGPNPPICVTRTVEGAALGSNITVRVTVTNLPYRFVLNVFGINETSFGETLTITYAR